MLTDSNGAWELFIKNVSHTLERHETRIHDLELKIYVMEGRGYMINAIITAAIAAVVAGIVGLIFMNAR